MIPKFLPRLAVTSLWLVAVATAAHANPYATLFDNAKYASGGRLDVTGDIPSLGARSFDNRTSSVDLLVPVPIAVYKEPNYQGACKTLYGDVPSLSGAGFGNDNLSSVRVHFTCESGPVELDACAQNPCGAGQLCVDRPRPAPADASGRRCVAWSDPVAPADAINVARGAVASNTAALPNLARGRPARAVPAYDTLSPARLTDGVTHGDYTVGTVVHTRDTPGNFLEVDLGAPSAIATVVIHNRTDCCGDRLASATLEVSTNACDASPRQVVASVAVPVNEYTPVTLVSLPTPATGRYLCVRQPGNIPLNVAELEAFGPEDDTRKVPAVARQSSEFEGAGASRVIDGDTNGDFSRGSVNHTAAASGGLPGDSSPWIEVDLRGMRRLGRVMIHNRTGGSGNRLTGARLELSLDPCNNPARRIVRDEQLTAFDRQAGVPPWANGAGYNALEAAVAAGTVKPILRGVSPAVQAIDFIDAPAARFVCLRHDVAQFLHVAEIAAYEGVAAENLTRRPGVSARQPTTYSGGEAARAIDGRTWGSWEHESVTHTTEMANPWLEIDLGATLPLRAIVLHNRTDCCSERLRGAWVQTSNVACDHPNFAPTGVRQVWDAPVDNGTIRRTVREAVGTLLASRDLPATRTQLDFTGESARYVCVRLESPAATLSLAEVEVFGTGTATPPAPEPPPAASVALASTPAVASVTPVATQVSASQIQVGLGAAQLTCDLVGTGAGAWDMACAGGPTLAMTGTVGAAYDLVSAAPLSLSDVTAGPWLPSALRGAGGVFDKILDVFGGVQLRLGLTQGKGFHLRGVLDLSDVPGAGLLGDGLTKIVGALKGLVPLDALDLTPAFELVPSVTASGATLSLRLDVITTCAAPPSLPALGTAVKLERGAIVLSLGVGASGLSVTAGLESKLYLKPSKFDPWLMVTPGFDLGVGGTGGTVTVRGALTGRCEEACASTCGCAPSACSQGWSPFGLSQLSLSQGFIELGAKTTGAVPTPSVKAAFQDARVGDVRGSFAIVFDTQNQQYGFRFGADRLPLLAAFQVFGGPLEGIAGLVPKELALRAPLVSFASAPMELYGVALPKGLRVRGGVDLGGLGLRGSIDATIDQGTPDLGALSQGKLVGAMPGGALKIRVEVPDIAALVVKVGGIGSFVRSMIEATFWVTKLELSFTLTANQVAVGAGIGFRLLGQTHDLGFSLGASWDLDDIVKSLADKVAGLVAGPLMAALNEVKAAAETAYRETSAALATGAAVVINGILTGGSIAIAATQEALGTISGYATKTWRAIKSFFGL